MIENVSNELKRYFEGKPGISSLLGFDIYFLYGSVALMFIDAVAGLGGFLGGLLFYVFIASVLMCLANRNFFALMIGLGAVALTNLIDLILWVSRWEMFSWSCLYATLVYGAFAYLAFRKTSAK